MSDKMWADTLKTVSEILQVLPIWIFAAISTSGWAVIYVPPFGSVDVTVVKRDWGWLAWCAAVVGTLFFVAKICNDITLLVIKRSKQQRLRSRIKMTRRYHQVYVPLNDLVSSVFTTEGSVILAAYFGQRVRNAWRELCRKPSLSSPIRRALTALVDRRIEQSLPETDFGGQWPSVKISNLIRLNREDCDLKLIELSDAADRTRHEGWLASSILSPEDALLRNHVWAEYKRLRIILDLQ